MISSTNQYLNTTFSTAATSASAIDNVVNLGKAL